MEFKEIHLSNQRQKIFNINRIKVEFKGRTLSICIGGSSILIESKWNLKHTNRKEKRSRKKILIESQWNLKVGKGKFSNEVLYILIESQWNLKVPAPARRFNPDAILIESQWNLKMEITYKKYNTTIYINRITVEFKEVIISPS